MKKRTLTILIAVVLVVACAVGGTLAWLTATSGPVTNTFTAGDVDITLTETFNTDTNNDGTKDAWKAQMVPGNEYTKDPVVSVNGATTNVDCYLFVKFEERNEAATYLNYTSTLTTINGWTQGDGNSIPEDVWYREVGVTDSTKSWHLLEDDKVTVDVAAVTKDNMSDAIKAELVYTAYAVQKDNIKTAADAWAKLPTTTTTTP